MFAGERSFNEMNILVNSMLFVQAVLVGYVLFYINRSASPRKSNLALNTETESPSFVRQCLAYSLIAGLSCLTVYQFVLSPGLANSDLLIAVVLEIVPEVVPETAAHWYGMIFGDSVLPWLAAGANVAVLITGMRLQMLAQYQNNAAKGLTALVIVCGFMLALIFLFWAFQLGLPTHGRSLAGSAYGVMGVLLCLFIALYGVMIHLGLWGRAREFLWFVILLSAGPALGYAFLLNLAISDWVPVEYVKQGDAYELAMIVGVFFPVLLAFKIAVYSKETGKFAIS